jgi:site-specific DNA-methyltransferase (adenine-specific)
MISYYSGDVVHAARVVPPASAALVYCDPPFAVQKQFKSRAKEEAEAAIAYDDRWPDLDAYLAWLDARLTVLWSLLRDDGCLILHLDQRAVHDAKVVGDRRFGRQTFAGEVIWVPGNGAKGKTLPMTHQTLLFWGKNGRVRWNGADETLREPYAELSQKMHFSNVDSDGRRYRDRVVGTKTYRYYADVGRAIGSVWSDCPAMAANTPLRKESTGYPTQKPKSLLRRLVRATTDPSDLVIDAFSGSGGLLETCFDEGRSAIGFDIGAASAEIVATRLADAKYAATFGKL